MSDLDPDRDADWALASAYVDGDADAAARARVDGDPQLLDLVAQVSAVRSALAAPVEVPAAARAAAIATALDLTEDGAPLGVVAAPVRSIDARRRRQVRWLGGAAAATLVAVMIGVSIGSRSHDGGSGAVSKAVATTVGGGSGDSGSNADAATAAAPEAAPATMAAGASTTVAANGTTPQPAAVVAVEDPDELLDLPVLGRVATAITDDTGCVDDSEVLLAVITYRGTAAVATLDVQAHVRRAKATTGCTVLAEVADPS